MDFFSRPQLIHIDVTIIRPGTKNKTVILVKYEYVRYVEWASTE